MLFALGFPPVKAVVLALLANTAPVAFGDPLIIPAFLVVVLAGWKKTVEVWPAVLTAGLSWMIPR